MKAAVKNNLFILAIAFKAAPLTVLGLLAIPAIHGVIQFFEHTYQIVFIIDAIQFGRPFGDVVRFVGIMFSIILLYQIIGSVFNARVEPKGKEKIYRAIRERLYAKAKNMDIACYDNPVFFNDFVFAMNNATQRVDGVIDTFARIINGAATLMVLGGFILFTDRVSFIFVAVAFALSYVFRIVINKMNFKLNEKLIPLQRKRDYINRVLYLPDFVKEIRLSRVKERLYADYDETEKHIYDTLKKPSRRIAVVSFLQDYLTDTFLFNFAYLLYLMFMTLVRGTLGFGAMFGLYRSANSASGTISGFSHSIAQLQDNSLYIERIHKFLSYEQTVTSPAEAKALTPVSTLPILEMRGVHFSYPEAATPTLSDVHFTINKGEKIAIVGYNGAGKTTLVKLLMRLYDPTSGEVFHNGTNIRAYDLNEYRDLFATLFQDYQIYAATVAQNVLASDAPPDEARLTQAIEKGGFSERLTKMPGGIHSQLTNEFTEGEELSGGERQKLATSRSLYKDSPILIMDEPSSVLDPIAEYELNNTMMNLGADKTVIFISHRLSTTKMADRIYMFDEGRLAESGSHEVLVKQNGKYAEMYRMQGEKYQ